MIYEFKFEDGKKLGAIDGCKSRSCFSLISLDREEKKSINKKNQSKTEKKFLRYLEEEKKERGINTNLKTVKKRGKQC